MCKNYGLQEMIGAVSIYFSLPMSVHVKYMEKALDGRKNP
jgi:hypothetical protein